MEQHYLESAKRGESLRFPLTDGHGNTIGRSDQNTIVLNNDGVSRFHALIQSCGPGLFLITDRGSSNGTFVNGAPVSTSVLLKDGDRITIGVDEFLFRSKREAAEAQPDDKEEEEAGSTRLFVARKLITVLVMDVRDFTGLGQQIPAEKLAEMMRSLFRPSGQILTECGAGAQKYIGDAVMAVWTHAGQSIEAREMANALRAVFRISQLVGEFQERFQLDAPIRIGAGINSGVGSVGNVGGAAFADHTAMGDVVNKAFRLESATKDLSVDLAIGEETHRYLTQITGPLKAFKLATVFLKGYPTPTVIYGTRFSALTDIIAKLDAVKGPRTGDIALPLKSPAADTKP